MLDQTLKTLHASENKVEALNVLCVYSGDPVSEGCHFVFLGGIVAIT